MQEIDIYPHKTNDKKMGICAHISALCNNVKFLGTSFYKKSTYLKILDHIINGSERANYALNLSTDTIFMVPNIKQNNKKVYIHEEINKYQNEKIFLHTLLTLQYFEKSFNPSNRKTKKININRYNILLINFIEYLYICVKKIQDICNERPVNNAHDYFVNYNGQIRAITKNFFSLPYIITLVIHMIITKISYSDIKIIDSKGSIKSVINNILKIYNLIRYHNKKNEIEYDYMIEITHYILRELNFITANNTDLTSINAWKQVFIDDIRHAT